MKLNMALEMDPPETSANESNTTTKKLYKDWKHSNKCYMIMMVRYVYMLAFQRCTLLKSFLRKLQRSCLTLIRSLITRIFWVIPSMVGLKEWGRYYITFLLVNKLKDIKMDIDEEFITFFVIRSLPSQFDSIRSWLNIKKKWCNLEELTAIFVKEENNIKLNCNTPTKKTLQIWILTKFDWSWLG